MCSLDYIGDFSCRYMDRDGKSQIRRMVFPFDLSMGIGYAISFLLLVPFSVGDCFIYGSIAGLLGYLSLCDYKEAEDREDNKACCGISGMGVCLVLYRLGLNYFREDFSLVRKPLMCLFPRNISNPSWMPTRIP